MPVIDRLFTLVLNKIQMMNHNSLLLSLFFLISLSKLSAQNTEKVKLGNDKIIIEISICNKETRDTIDLQYSPVEALDAVGREWESNKQKLSQGHAEWNIESNEPIYISAGSLLKEQKSYWLAEPGDRIKIVCDSTRITFEGKGAEKIKLENNIALLKNGIKKPSNPVKYNVRSIEDYLEWNENLNNQLMLILPVIDSYRDKISSFAFTNIRARFIDRIEEDRMDKFWGLRGLVMKNIITNKNLCDIFDSTCFRSEANWLHSLSNTSIGGRYGFVRSQVFRKYEFDISYDSLKDEGKRRFLYYEQGKKTYVGLAREKFLKELLTLQTIHKIGLTPEVEKLLTRYYEESKNLVYKKMVKGYELKERELKNKKTAPDFVLTDVNGKPFTKNDVKNKIALLDFWFTGCVGCVQMASVLEKVEEAFRSDTNVVFLSISTDVDKEKWLRSINQKKYTTGTGINLYSGGLGGTHPIISSYNVTSFPCLYLLDAMGRIVSFPFSNPREDNGAKLIDLIRKQVMLMKDGPYVFYKNGNNTGTAYYINESSVNSTNLNNQISRQITVQSDEYGKDFNLELKQKLSTEPAEFLKPQKLLALSDIEGNFEALRKLLQANKVIDENFNWIFGDGHLVFVGDMVDRGEEVTQCLWLIYALEEKAKKAGGYVHYILGNHEIMNLNGDIRYVQNKYRKNAEKMGMSYTNLYDKNSELGRWLRTKNIIEKIGDLLFVHGGISEELNEVTMSVKQINDLARPYYDRESIAQNSNDKALAMIFNSKDNLSPFWYRNYYLEQEKIIMIGGKKGLDTVFRASLSQVNKTLEKFDVSHIITGHTIVGKNETYGQSITAHFDYKVINTDTHHASGKSEGLLIDGGNYYRVNANGEKIMLYSSPKYPNIAIVR
jgi:thiol-disulfide isomerase/thioredoxin